jgi:2-polyprenyl-6-methoxyphenol hydroxylase-like FAD-dependent oxidoreductase
VADIVDVLIVGAGPTGLTLANDLRRRGVNFRIIDKADAATTISKAIVVHARNLEMFENMSLVEPFLAHGMPIRGSNIYSQNKRIVHLNTDEIESFYKFILAIPQSKTEEILADNLAGNGVNIERSKELVSLCQNGEEVVATLKCEGQSEPEIVKCRYLVGCDGAHSAARHGLGLTFEGVAYEEVFGAADVAVDTGSQISMLEDEAYIYFSESGLVTFFPFGGGRYRLIFDMTPDSSVDAASELKFEEVVELVKTRLNQQLDSPEQKPLTISDPHWLSWFKINRRCVTSYRQGRVFLAGDAAHIHSPVGGVGMNTGMQDAMNLSWKLHLALNDLAADNERLLDTYHEERHTVGQAVLKGTDMATKAVTLRNPLAKNVRDRMMSFLSAQEVVQQRILRAGSLTGISYRQSSLSAEAHRPLERALKAVDSGILRFTGHGEVGERPGFKSWMEFTRGPVAGDRVVDGPCQTTNGKSTRLALQMASTKFQLLLFDGFVNSEPGYLQFGAIEKNVEEHYKDLIDVHVIVPALAKTPKMPKFKSLLLDAERELHNVYGASSECLYLIRPDGYIAFRSQPASWDELSHYLVGLLKSS